MPVECRKTGIESAFSAVGGANKMAVKVSGMIEFNDIATRRTKMSVLMILPSYEEVPRRAVYLATGRGGEIASNGVCIVRE